MSTRSGVPELAPGAVVEDLYEILCPIGRGGMAVVYAARRVDDGGEVAIKVLSALGEDGAEREARFFRELLFATRVRHPNIVRVTDFGVMRDRDAAYLVMERLHGTTLHALLRTGGALPTARVARLFRGVLAALAEAHAAGLVHRDLKPSNLFVREADGGTEELVVLDFGIAHRAGGEPGAPRWTAATPRYAAPEYIRDHEVRPCLDVYQVGLVMAEALAGRPVITPVDAERCFRAHLAGVELPPEALASRLGPLIRRATDRDPARRPADAGEMLAMLDALADRALPAPLPGLGPDEDSQITPPSSPSSSRSSSSPSSEDAGIDHVDLRPAVVAAEPRAWERVPAWVPALIATVALALALTWAVAGR